MKIELVHHYVTHEGHTFRRERDLSNKDTQWMLNQKTDEFDLWSRMPEGAAKNLEKMYKLETATICECCCDDGTDEYPLVVLDCGHVLCSYCAIDGCTMCPDSPIIKV